MAITKKNDVIEIKPVIMDSAKLRIVGDTPLIVHAWGEKAKKEMLDAQMGKGKVKKKEAKNPVAEFACAAYWMDGEPDIPYAEWDEENFTELATQARFGFPAVAIKNAAVSAAYRNEMSKDKVSLRGAFSIDGEGLMQLVEIKGAGVPEMREDNVRIGMGTADLRYRPQFNNWYMDITLRYIRNGKYSLEDIINIINLGGFTCGIGEWRNEKGGVFGSFHVATTE